MKVPEAPKVPRVNKLGAIVLLATMGVASIFVYAWLLMLIGGALHIEFGWPTDLTYWQSVLVSLAFTVLANGLSR